MSHFSRFIRPGAKRIGINLSNNEILATAAENADGSIAIIVFNEKQKNQEVLLVFNGKSTRIPLSGQALQTVIIK